MKHLTKHKIDNVICPDCGNNNTETIDQFYKEQKKTTIFTTINYCSDCKFKWLDNYGYLGTESA